MFEISAAFAQQDRKAAKAGNKNGDPISMKSKILAAIADPFHPSDGVFIAESAGTVRRLNINVCSTLRPALERRLPVTHTRTAVYRN
jgi:hypothetical protein